MTPSDTPLDLVRVPMFGHTCFALVDPDTGSIRACGFDDLDALTARLPADQRARGHRAASEDHPVEQALLAYRDGQLDAIDDLPVDQPGGPFHAQARAALREVRAGAPVTYTDLATAAGRPTAARAAASACATNLVALVVPCHRIVRSDGRLGGYLFGEPLKQALLDHERAHAATGADGVACAIHQGNLA